MDISQKETETRFVITNEQKQAMIEAKKRVESVLTYIIEMEKKHGKTKQTKKATKLMKDFLKCNVTNVAIFRKYNDVVTFIEKHSQNEDPTNASET